MKIHRSEPKKPDKSRAAYDRAQVINTHMGKPITRVPRVTVLPNCRLELDPARGIITVTQGPTVKLVVKRVPAHYFASDRTIVCYHQLPFKGE